jgi:hypothetical protein
MIVSQTWHPARPSLVLLAPMLLALCLSCLGISRVDAASGGDPQFNTARIFGPQQQIARC